MPTVAMVVSTVGFHWEEVFAAYWAFKDAGATVDVYSVDGKPARPDPFSLRQTGPASLLGIGISASIAPTTPRGVALGLTLEAIAPLSHLDPERVDALYLPGGHGCLFDVNRDAKLHALIARLFERGCVLSGVCHATSTFAFVSVGGRSIVSGHAMTGFPHPLDRALIASGLVASEFLPLPLINDEELRTAGAKLTLIDVAAAMVDPRTTRISAPFITGVGPKAAGKVARAVAAALGVRKEASKPERSSATA